jgi:hypothetical protein
LNEPVGKIADVTFLILRSQPLKANQGLPDEVRKAIDLLLRTRGNAESVILCFIGTQLALLYWLDPDWTREHILPLFDWQATSEAQAAWIGYLSVAQVLPRLWDDLKTFFIQAFDHLDELAEPSKNLIRLLVGLATENDEALTSEESRDCLRKVSSEELRWAAERLALQLKGAGEQASVLWREAIGPFLREVWPRERQKRTPMASAYLSLAAVRSGDAFSEAVPVILDFVCPVNRGYGLGRELEESGLLGIAPTLVLELLDAIIEENTTMIFEGLGNCLVAMRTALPQIATDNKFRRLHEVAMRTAW